ncbi:MAG: phosphoribosylformylglycinamidine synthase, partial [Spirochaetes bacterium]|nr:phosphoribosylformylglycinamidine synthase [Spirochaetota bacterium]
WLSESQERMTLSVPDETLDAFIDLMKRRGVEATVIGRFTGDSRGVVRHGGRKIFDMDMTFLHDGLPKKRLETSYTKSYHPFPHFDEPRDMTPDFIAMAGRLNTASFEFISTQYDHEVQGGSVIKPLQGRGRVNGSATVIRPILDSWRGAVLSQGIYPSYGDIDTYWMAACSIDTAVRNAVAAGGSLEQMAILDNFCWCDSTNPERLGQLREAARACYDSAVAYGTPFISGKDSMFNDFRGYDEEFREATISIPPTLLISSIGVVEDIRKCQTIDFKIPGDLVYCLGTTGDETGGSEYLAYMGEKISGMKYSGDAVPRVDADEFKKTYRALEGAIREGLVASCISVERGGLGLALAKSAMAGMRGVEIDLAALPAGIDRNDYLLFSESQGRVLVSVGPEKREAFEKVIGGVPAGLLGTVSDGPDVVIRGVRGNPVVMTDVDSLQEAYRGLFRDF